MHPPDNDHPSAPKSSSLQSLLAFMARHPKAVRNFEIAVFSLMIPLQLYGADLQFSWRGWAIAMFGVLLGTSLTMRFGNPTSPQRTASRVG
jgi:hypothetical protein